MGKMKLTDLVSAEDIDEGTRRAAMSKARVKRWKVVVTHRIGVTTQEDVHEIEELYDLDRIIEKGPDWQQLIDIRITYQL